MTEKPSADLPLTCPGARAPEGVPELFTREFADDPYPAYAWLREHAPVHRTRLPSGVEAWLVTRYGDARQALADQRLSKNPAHHDEPAHARGRTGIPGERKADLMTHLLNIDPPDHTRLRRLVSKAFTPRRVAAFEPRVQELTDRLIDDFAARGQADLIHEFAFPLPIYAICDMLGVPAGDQDDFRDWAAMMIRHAGAPRGGVARSVKKMRGYLADLIHRKRGAPGDDLISSLIRTSDHGEQLTENEAAAMAFILLFAGFETTVNLIGNGTLALLRHPGQRERLMESLQAGRPELLATGIEELLRYDGPVELATWRYATRPLDIGGQRIAAGDAVLVVLAAADRDPARFADPDVLDLGRTDNAHLGYGHGIHYCLGAPLARLEGRTALATLLRRLPDLTLAVPESDLRRRGGLIMRGLRDLPVRFTPVGPGTRDVPEGPEAPEGPGTPVAPTGSTGPADSRGPAGPTGPTGRRNRGAAEGHGSRKAGGAADAMPAMDGIPAAHATRGSDVTGGAEAMGVSEATGVRPAQGGPSAIGSPHVPPPHVPIHPEKAGMS